MKEQLTNLQNELNRRDVYIDQLLEKIDQLDAKVADLNKEIENLQNLLVEAASKLSSSIKKAVKQERMRAEEQYNPWKPVYQGD